MFCCDWSTDNTGFDSIALSLYSFILHFLPSVITSSNFIYRYHFKKRSTRKKEKSHPPCVLLCKANAFNTKAWTNLQFGEIHLLKSIWYTNRGIFFCSVSNFPRFNFVFFFLFGLPYPVLLGFLFVVVYLKCNPAGKSCSLSAICFVVFNTFWEILFERNLIV